MATIAAVALTAVQPSMAFAGAAPSGKGVTASAGTSDATDISARRRYYRGGGGAAAAAAFAGIVGTGIAIAAAQNRRDYYDSYGYYGGGPVYYGGGYGDPIPYGWLSAYSARMRAVLSAPLVNAITIISSLKMNPPAAPAGGFFWLPVRPLTRWPGISIRFEA